ncbi:MAG: J domain-containing protein [Eubacteriales bacterium]
MTDPYQILGVSRNATDEQVKAAYRALARKYHPDNYTSDNPLADLATEKMKQINEAYEQIQKERAGGAPPRAGGDYTGGYTGSPLYAEIRRLIQTRRMNEAEARLKQIPPTGRDAEWHYLTSIILTRRGYLSDAMRELEIACEMDPGNAEYQQAKQMFNTRAGGFGSMYYDTDRPTRGGCSGSDGNCCLQLLCADCCCEMLGGDLIPCC